jgi:hypothetical protein
MIKLVIDLLTSNEWYNSNSDVIEIAKGKYELPSDFKGTVSKIKRIWQLRK